jgi:hypothetical protein
MSSSVRFPRATQNGSIGSSLSGDPTRPCPFQFLSAEVPLMGPGPRPTCDVVATLVQAPAAGAGPRPVGSTNGERGFLPLDKGLLAFRGAGHKGEVYL